MLVYCVHSNRVDEQSIAALDGLRRTADVQRLMTRVEGSRSPMRYCYVNVVGSRTKCPPFLAAPRYMYGRTVDPDVEKNRWLRQLLIQLNLLQSVTTPRSRCLIIVLFGIGLDTLSTFRKAYISPGRAMEEG